MSPNRRSQTTLGEIPDSEQALLVTPCEGLRVRRNREALNNRLMSRQGGTLHAFGHVPQFHCSVHPTRNYQVPLWPARHGVNGTLVPAQCEPMSLVGALPEVAPLEAPRILHVYGRSLRLQQRQGRTDLPFVQVILNEADLRHLEVRAGDFLFNPRSVGAGFCTLPLLQFLPGRMLRTNPLPFSLRFRRLVLISCMPGLSKTKQRGD